MKLLVALMLLLCPAAAWSATPQSSGSDLVMQPLDPAPPPAYVPPQVEHLFGDLGGVRTNLDDLGIYLRLDATMEFAGNVSGGVQQGATSANQIGFEADMDWQRLVGVSGLSTHVIFVNRSGASDSHLFGDNLSPVQEIYGSGGNVAFHLVSAYAQEKLLDQKVDLAAGWMNVENDFASSPLYCNYMNNALCGDPKALPGGDIGHSAYPEAVWGGRVRVQPTPEFYAETGVYEVNPDLYTNKDRSGFEFAMPRASGVYVPVQFAYEPKYGADHLPGHYVIGFGYDTSRYRSFTALPTTSAPQQTRIGNTQLWLLVDQMLIRSGSGDQDGLIALGGVIDNNAEISTYAQQYIAGLLDGGFWRARPQDTIGLLFSYFAMSGPLGKVQAEEAEFGLPISNSATAVQTHEMILEADYNIHAYRGVDFRPDFQYVIRPNAQADIRNAVVLGFKLHVEF